MVSVAGSGTLVIFRAWPGGVSGGPPGPAPRARPWAEKVLAAKRMIVAVASVCVRIIRMGLLSGTEKTSRFSILYTCNSR
jgi:hypothetical protein